MWSVAVSKMCINVWVWASWTTPVMASVIPVVWPGTASVGIMMTLAVISVRMGIWSRPTVSVPVFMMVAWVWYSLAATMRLWSMVMCRCTWRRYLMWAIHYNVTILITLKTLNIGIMTCYMTWFLVLKTVIFLMRHNIHCWGWYQCGYKLLCGLQLLNFRLSVCRSLYSLFIDLSSYIMSIFKSFWWIFLWWHCCL